MSQYWCLWAGGYGWGWILRLIGWREDSKMALTSSSPGRMDPPKGCCQCLCPQGELQSPPASLGDSPRSAGRSASGYCQMTTSALILEQVRLWCAPFKSGDSISHSSLGLPKVSPIGLQRQTFWGLVFPAQDRWPGEPEVGLRPFPPWGEPL